MSADLRIDEMPRIDHYPVRVLREHGVETFVQFASLPLMSVWTWIGGHHPSFVTMIEFMKASGFVFRDCDPREVDLTRRDIEATDLRLRVKNYLEKAGVVSFAMLSKLTRKDIADIRGIGRGTQSFDEVMAMVKANGVTLALF